MSFALLDLADGAVSLEMRPGDVPALRARLKHAFGDVEVTEHATHADVLVGGERFLFTNDWEDPCLISTSETGAGMLRQLAETRRPDGELAAAE